MAWDLVRRKLMITKQETEDLVKKFGKGSNDSGSASVQVAILTTRINNLAPHFNKFKKDKHSQRGLLKMIGRRKALLKYIQKKDQEGYTNLIKELGLRK